MMLSVQTAARRLVCGAITALKGPLVEVPVIRGPARGLRLKLDLVKGGENAYWLGRYDPAILSRLARVCKEGWTVWDAGTYLGFYSVFFARAVGPLGHVVAIEPDSRSLERTKSNVALNGYQNVTFLKAAIGAGTSEVEFVLSDTTTSHISGTYVGACASAVTTHQQSIQTRCMSLDQVLYECLGPPPQLVKMDIEGAEKDALQHASYLAEEIRPLILLELHNPECDAEAWQFAQRFDYVLKSMKTNRVIENPTDVNGTVLLTPKP